jgi:hypothetical protein
MPIGAPTPYPSYLAYISHAAAVCAKLKAVSKLIAIDL